MKKKHFVLMSKSYRVTCSETSQHLDPPPLNAQLEPRFKKNTEAFQKSNLNEEKMFKTR